MKNKAIAGILASVLMIQSVAFADEVQMRRGDRGDRRGDRQEDRRDDRRWDRRDDRRDSRHDDRRDRRDDRRKDDIKGAAIAAGVIGIIGLIAAASNKNNNPPVREFQPDYRDDSQYQQPSYDSQSDLRRTVFFDDITRRTGGEWVRIKFQRAAYIDFLEFILIENGLKIHEVSLVTQSGRRVAMPELAGLNAMAPATESSDYVRAGEKIIAIDIRAESMGGPAYVGFSVTSSSETPQVVGIRP